MHWTWGLEPDVPPLLCSTAGPSSVPFPRDPQAPVPSQWALLASGHCLSLLSVLSVPLGPVASFCPPAPLTGLSHILSASPKA